MSALDAVADARIEPDELGDRPLQGLVTAGVLGELDRHLALAVARRTGDERPELLLAVALASRSVRLGHLCAELARAPRAVVVEDQPARAWRVEAPVPELELVWPALPGWLTALRASPAVTAVDRVGDAPRAALDRPRPLVVDGAGRVYLARYARYEATIVTSLRERARLVEALPLARLRPLVARCHGESARDGGDAAQERAALLGLVGHLTLVTGGPGTGKTFSVTRILALLVEAALAADEPPPRVALLAPTGKAAQRLAESMRGALAALAVPPRVAAALAVRPRTLHLGLGYDPRRPTHFRHHRAHPLAADVVVVDEASMVDAALMAKLLDAVAPTARLLLLGDRDQLASVEAGSVFADLSRGAPGDAGSVALTEQLAALTLGPVPQGASRRPYGLADCSVELTHSRRFRPDGGVGRLVAAVHTGRPERLLEVLASGDPAITWCDPHAGSPDHAPLAPTDAERVVRHALAPLLDRAFPKPGPVPPTDAERLATVERFRILCATRRGPFGVEAVGALVERWLTERGLIAPDEEWYVGRPILITTNDNTLSIFNGDVGVVVPALGNAGREIVLAGAADDGQPALRRFAPGRLPTHQTVFAMTIHKSQGSELEHLAVVLPDHPSPLATRELLYTAVSRARSALTLVATPAALAMAVRTQVERASGLGDALWGPAPPSPVSE